MVGRYREDWPAAQQAFFTFYEADCLNEALAQLQAQLKKVDRRLAQHRRAPGDWSSHLFRKLRQYQSEGHPIAPAA